MNKIQLKPEDLARHELINPTLEKAAYIALSKIGKSDELVDSEGKSKGL